MTLMTKFLFDVDGTLTDARKPIDPKFEKINHKYPTAALAVIKIKDGNWENLYNNQNELIDFITPKDLK